MIGTWGTVFFPIMWESFREWWKWKEECIVLPVGQGGITDRMKVELEVESGQEERKKYCKKRSARDVLFIDNLVTDKFYMDNAHIWSPWIIRYIHFMTMQTDICVSRMCVKV